MSSTTPSLRRRLASLAGAGALAAGTLAVTTAPASAAETVDDATFTWGLSGYAQSGIFGPWTFKDLTGDATYLKGSISGGTQTEYVVAGVPTTSMPASSPQKTPNAVKFTAGEGTVDRATGAASLSWDGSYTVNAYPAVYGAPNEIYSDPELTVEADGSGELTMDFTIGAGTDMAGNPFEAKDFGRLTLASFDAGSLSGKSFTGYRVTPDYQGVQWDAPTDVAPQDRSCTAAGTSTGWWGAWPTELLDALASHESGKAVAAHFYSTGCAGKQDNKPALPFDVSFPADAPTVEVSQTEIVRGGTTTVTVTGSGFDPSLATGVRPPFTGQKSGLYVAFGRYADVWRPSAGAPSSARTNPSGANGTGAAVKWAVPAASFAASNPAQSLDMPAYTELRADGTFSTEIKVDEDWLSSASGNFGIYTYAGGGATVAAYETATPLMFVDARATVKRTGDLVAPTRTTTGSVAATVETTGPGTPAGTLRAVLTQGSTTVSGPKATLSSAGTATVTVPKVPALGRWTLALRYSGDGAHQAVSGGRATFDVSTYAVGVTRSAIKKPTTTADGSAKVVVTSDAPVAPTGKVRAVLTNGTTTLTGPAVTLAAGSATVVLPKVPGTGTWTFKVAYLGDANHPARTGWAKKLDVTR